MIETIIFDYGGVITSGARSRGFIDWASRAYGAAVDELRAVFAGPMFLEYLRGKLSPRQFYSVFQELGIDVDPDSLSARLMSFNEPVPRMKALIEKLAGEYDLCLISDSTPDLTRDVKQRFMNTFRVACFSDEEGCVKDDQVLFNIAFQRIGRDLVKCLYIDDREEKLSYPRTQGVECIHFVDFDSFVCELATRCGQPAAGLILDCGDE